MTSALAVFLDPRRHHHAFLFFTDLARRYRSLIWELTRREIAERYVGQVLGTAWAIGHPLIAIAVYIFVFAYIFGMRTGGTSDTSFDYTTFLLSGLIPWLTFADILNRSCNSVTSNAAGETNLVPCGDSADQDGDRGTRQPDRGDRRSAGLYYGSPWFSAAAVDRFAGNLRGRGHRSNRSRLRLVCPDRFLPRHQGYNFGFHRRGYVCLAHFVQRGVGTEGFLHSNAF